MLQGGGGTTKKKNTRREGIEKMGVWFRGKGERHRSHMKGPGWRGNKGRGDVDEGVDSPARSGFCRASDSG